MYSQLIKLNNQFFTAYFNKKHNHFSHDDK